MSDYKAYYIYNLKKLFVFAPVSQFVLVFAINCMYFKAVTITIFLFSFLYASIIYVASIITVNVMVSKQIKSDAYVGQFITVNISKNDISIKSNDKSFRVRYETILKLCEVGNAFYIYLTKEKALIVPKYIFSPDELDRLSVFFKEQLDDGKLRLIKQKTKK